jgi:hypothetical protein
MTRIAMMVPLFLVLLPAVIISAAATADADEDASTFTFSYRPVWYPSSYAGNNTVLTGLTTGSSCVSDSDGCTLYYTGYSDASPHPSVAFLYYGEAGGADATWTTLTVESGVNKTVTSAVFMSPYITDASRNAIDMVGNYKTTETESKYDFGFLFTGFTNGTGTFTDIDPSALVADTVNDAVLNTNPRCVNNGLIVGYYTTKLTPNANSAFVYDIATETFYALLFPAGNAISAHSVYLLRGSTYLIVGAITDSSGIVSGFICHWDNVNHIASDYQLYQRSSDAKQTHFNGLTSAGNDKFYVASDWIEIANTTTGVKTYGLSLVTLSNVSDTASSSGISWQDFVYPDSNNNSAVAVSGSYVVGSMQPLANGNLPTGSAYGYLMSYGYPATSSKSSLLSRTAIIAIVVCLAGGIAIAVAFVVYRQQARKRAATAEANTEMSSSPMYDAREKGDSASMFTFKTAV